MDHFVRKRTDYRVYSPAYCAMKPSVRAKQFASKDLGPGVERANQLLGVLPAAESRRLIARCERIEMTFGNVLCQQGDRIRHIYFPTGGFVSLLSRVDRLPGLEVGLVGAEGAVGVSLALGIAVSPLQALVQGSGPALRMEAATFANELERHPNLRAATHRYIYVLMSQLAQMATCARFHTVEARLARWLLMTRDRAGSDAFYLTQEFMAYMLGVRRVGVTRAAGALQARHLVRYHRGRMIILDARGLEATSCRCYSLARSTYRTFTRQGRERQLSRRH